MGFQPQHPQIRHLPGATSTRSTLSSRGGSDVASPLSERDAELLVPLGFVSIEWTERQRLGLRPQTDPVKPTRAITSMDRGPRISDPTNACHPLLQDRSDADRPARLRLLLRRPSALIRGLPDDDEHAERCTRGRPGYARQGHPHLHRPAPDCEQLRAVRIDIQTVRDGTAPRPLFARCPWRCFPARESTSDRLGGDGSLQSTVNRPELFSHELGHLLLPGDDHVSDPACMVPDLPMTHINADYPDYSNAIQRAGIGEYGVDLVHRLRPARSGHPIIGYCGDPRWIRHTTIFGRSTGRAARSGALGNLPGRSANSSWPSACIATGEVEVRIGSPSAGQATSVRQDLRDIVLALSTPKACCSHLRTSTAVVGSTPMTHPRGFPGGGAVVR